MNFGEWRLEEDDYGYPICVVDIDGVEARITAEQKPLMAARGIWFIGSKFEQYTVRDSGPGFVKDDEFAKQVMLPFLSAVRRL